MSETKIGAVVDVSTGETVETLYRHSGDFNSCPICSTDDELRLVVEVG